MDDCTNCEFLAKCRNGEKVKCPEDSPSEVVYNPNIITYEDFLKLKNKEGKNNVTLLKMN